MILPKMSSSATPITIVFIKPNDSSFIRGDQKLFEKFYRVKPFLMKQLKGKLNYAVKNMQLFFYLLSFAFKKDVIFTTWFADYHAATMVFAARLTGKKSIIFIGGQEAVCYPELNKGVYRKKVRGWLVAFALRKTDLIIANHKSLIYHENHYYNSEHPHIDGIKHYVSRLKTPIQIVYNGIDSSRIKRDESLPKQENMVLTVGTMYQEGDFYNKGFDLFMQTAERNPQLSFVLIGLNKAYLDWADEKCHFRSIPNLKVIPTFCPDELLNECYNTAKVFVQASITEGMPNTLSEAMLLECVPVGSNVNGIPDAIGDTGIVIKRRTVEDLEAGILDALKLNTSKQARERVIQLFSFELREQKLKVILSQFCAGKNFRASE